MSNKKQNLFQRLREILGKGEDPVDYHAEIWDTYGTTVAVMILDSTGFSRVSEEHGILHFLSRLVMMRDIVGPILEAHGHAMRKFEADNVFVVFDHPDQAIKAARDIHVRVREEGLMLTEQEPFRVCIGIGYGSMLYSETLEGYFGEQMNLASKLGEDTANGGETLITEDAYHAASAALQKGFCSYEVTVSGVAVSYYRDES